MWRAVVEFQKLAFAPTAVMLRSSCPQLEGLELERRSGGDWRSSHVRLDAGNYSVSVESKRKREVFRTGESSFNVDALGRHSVLLLSVAENMALETRSLTNAGVLLDNVQLRVFVESVEVDGYEGEFKVHMEPLDKLQLSLPRETNRIWRFEVDSKESLSFRLMVRGSESGKVLASCFVTADEMRSMHGMLIRPLVKSNSVRGRVKMRFLVVTPFQVDASCHCDAEGAKLDALRVIGHRGDGMTRKEADGSPVENTLDSFFAASERGVSGVEFDVQLSRDGVPVVVHDEEIAIVDRSGQKLLIPVNKLDIQQLRRLYPLTTLNVPWDKVGADLPTRSTYPTLQALFEELPLTLTFNLEVKYPDREIEIQRLGVIERNEFVNRILDVVFARAGSRPVVFSSFDCDIVTMLSAKQACYPVLFLTDAGKSRVHNDPRRNTVDEAINFAINNELAGVVAESSALMKDLTHLVKKTKDAGLVMLSYGEANVSKEEVARQLAAGVTAVISDNIIDAQQGSMDASRRFLDRKESLQADLGLSMK